MIRPGPILLLLTTLSLAGCQEDPRIIVRDEKRVAALERFLGALIYHPEATWTFKLTGKDLAVSEHVEEFNQLVRSSRFNEQGELIFDQPQGWTRDDKDGQDGIKRHATFQLGPKEKPLEAVIHKLPPNAGSPYDNANRWRMQLGLYQMGPGDLQDFVIADKIAGHDAYFIDFLGPGLSPRAAAAMPQRPDLGGRGAAAASAGLKYEAPPAWKEAPLAPFSIATWDVGDGGKVTISEVGGSVLENVNRWRTTQLGLPAATATDLDRDMREIPVGAKTGMMVELVNPNARQRSNALLAVIVPQDGQNLYFVMRGPAEVVARHKASFENFLRSVEFK